MCDFNNSFPEIYKSSRNQKPHLCYVIILSQTNKLKMKLKMMFPITAMLLVVLMGSCNKDDNSLISPLSSDVSSVKKSTISSIDNTAATASLMAQNKKAGNKANGKQLATVNLGVAGNFVILSKSGITDVYKSAITGNIGSSPITGAAIVLSCAEVTGTIYTVDAAGPLPCRVINASMLTTAVSNMQTAYTDAAGRSNPDFLNLGAGNIGGLTLSPGLYKFTSAVVIPTDVTIAGGPNDIWIFQVAGTLDMSSAVKITLTKGAQAKNIFWQISGAVTLGTTSHFEGNILGQTGINLQTGASINGRMLAQTAVTLQMNTVNKPQ
jgi:hypothetical protein